MEPHVTKISPGRVTDGQTDILFRMSVSLCKPAALGPVIFPLNLTETFVTQI